MGGERRCDVRFFAWCQTSMSQLCHICLSEVKRSPFPDGSCLFLPIKPQNCYLTLPPAMLHSRPAGITLAVGGEGSNSRLAIGPDATECPLIRQGSAMLALSFRDGDYAFVYHAGIAIGAILFGDEKSGRRRVRMPVRFAGRKDTFEILRPQAVERRYGKQELEQLTEQFLHQPATCAALPERACRCRSSRRPA